MTSNFKISEVLKELNKEAVTMVENFIIKDMGVTTESDLSMLEESDFTENRILKPIQARRLIKYWKKESLKEEHNAYEKQVEEILKSYRIQITEQLKKNLEELLKDNLKSKATLQLTNEFPTLKSTTDSSYDPRSFLSKVVCEQPSGNEQLYETVINQWLNPEHDKAKELVAIVGQARVGKTETLKSFLREVRHRYDYIFYVSLKNINCSNEMNILQFLTNQSSMRWMDYKTDQDYQLFKRFVEMLNDSKKVCIIFDDLEKSNFSYEEYRYTRSLFDKMQAGYLVYNTIKHWFENGQKIFLSSPMQFLHLNRKIARNPMSFVYVQGINYAGQKEILGNRTLSCKRKGCEIGDICLGEFITDHEAEKCSICQRCWKNNCHHEMQSLCFAPYNCGQLANNTDISQLKSTTPISIAASLLSHKLNYAFGSDLKSSQTICSFAWENYANGVFIFYESDLLNAELSEMEINVFFSVRSGKSESSSSHSDPVFFFTHVLLQELLASLWILSLPRDQLMEKLSDMAGHFQVVRDFMYEVLQQQLSQTRFWNIPVENVPELTAFLSKLTFLQDAAAAAEHLQKLSITHQPPKATSILKFGQPIFDMVLTETYYKIRSKVKEKNVMILQCNGVPGSGKSQIIRKLAEEFSYATKNKDNVVVKWHIQCEDKNEKVQEELTTLAERLLKNSFNVTQEIYQNIADSLNIDEAHYLVDVLIKIQKPILLIIEDPPLQAEKLVVSLCTALASRSNKMEFTSAKFHVYITSSRTIAILSDFFKNKSCYKLSRVEGFNEEEAISYLQAEKFEEETAQSQEKEAVARRIYERFSGLPLGLRAAKGYCKLKRLNYADYIEVIKDTDYDIISEEKNAIKEEYGDAIEHVFQSIVMPFEPRENDNAAILSWKILRCISYFHHNQIPIFAMEQCCHILRERKVKNPHIENKLEIGALITKLFDHGMCIEAEENAITFHEVVLNAFRLYQHSVVDEFNPLKKAIEIMCSLVSKDLSKKEHSTKMNKMRRHLLSLLVYIDKNETIFDDKDQDLLKALTSYLHEAAGAIMLYESYYGWKKSEDHFEKALQLIWPEVMKNVDVPKKNWNDTAQKIGRNIVEFSKRKASNLCQNFTTKYVSKLELSFEEDELAFLRSKCGSKNCYNGIKKVIKEKDFPEVLIKKLQECGLFLSDEQYLPMFYAERFAFILHSWSRLVLFCDPEDVQYKRDKCDWISRLSNSVSIECKKSYGKSLLSEHLSKITGQVPIALKLKKSKQNLKTALHNCTEVLHEKIKPDMYENGILKEVYGPSDNYTRIFLLRYIVRINARLHKSASSGDAEADKQCKELFDLSVKHVNTSRTCLMCLIYCAKYYAAKRELENALTCLKKYYQLENEHELKFNVQCWATYNYARVVCELKDNSKEKDAAIEKLQTILKENRDVIKKGLQKHLKDCLERLLCENSNSSIHD